MPFLFRVADRTRDHRHERRYVSRCSVVGFFLLTWLLTFPRALPAQAQETDDDPTRPNILLAISDDQSWIHAGAYGTQGINTPAFDRVAEEGVLFTHAFTAAPSCTPSRSAILTGQQIWRLEEGGLLFGALPARFDVFPQLLQEAGYTIGNTGKTWSPGSLEAGGRTEPPTGEAYTQVKLDSARKGMSPLDYAANFRAFLNDRSEDKPFFFWYGAREPHLSYNDGQGLAAGKDLEDARLFGSLPDDPLVRSDVLDYYVEIEHFDRHLQRMLNELERRGELSNTLVLVTSDHGMPFPRAKANGLYDSSTRVPLAIAWPDQIPPGRQITDFVSLTDVAPTVLEAAGASLPSAMTGRSLLPVLQSTKTGRTASGRDKIVLAFERHTWCRPDGAGYPIRAIRTYDHLYVRNYEPNRWPAGNPTFDSPHQGFYGDIDDSPTKSFMVAHQNDPDVAPYFELAFEKRPAEELYDLNEDPAQIENVAGDPSYGSVKKELRRQLNDYLRETEDPRVQGHNPWDRYPYYYQDYWKRVEN